MSAYRTVVVGTDGSDSSLRAVEKAGTLAGADAKLIVATAYLPQHEDPRAADALKGESYKVSGSAPIYAILREARERAHAAGAANIEERSVDGDVNFQFLETPVAHNPQLDAAGISARVAARCVGHRDRCGTFHLVEAITKTGPGDGGLVAGVANVVIALGCRYSKCLGAAR